MAKFNEKNQSNENGGGTYNNNNNNNQNRKKEFEIKVPKLILRNLSFKLNEEDLKSELIKYGKIDEVCIPKKSDGTQCGYGFVKYSSMTEAKSALETLNQRKEKLFGTKIVVDWCLPKRLYLKNRDEYMAENVTESLNGSKKEAKTNEKNEDKDESDDAGDDDEQQDDADVSEESEQDGGGSENEEEESDKDDGDEDDDGDEEKETKVEKKVAKKPSKFDLKAKTGTKDVQEKRTVFIRNLSFDTTLETMNKAFEKFGKIKNSFLCYDRDFERPRGTGFIQFEEAQSAINACAESNLLEIDSRNVQIDMALSRTQVKGVVDERKTKEPKDNRNLALAKFGIVYPNSYEGKELSKSDLDKRAKIEAGNRAKLKLLHYFVSPTRLSVHNIPIKCTDEQLKKIFLNVFDENERKSVRLIECRIMRDLTRVNSEGVAKSKGFGFVEFKSFDHALKALKATNNNPELFDDKKTRLIVQFSIEDMRALKKKERRVAKHENKNRILSRKNDSNYKRKSRNDEENAGEDESKKKVDKDERDKKKNKNLINVELIQKKIKRKLEEEDQEQKSKGNQKKQKTSDNKNNKSNQVKSSKKNSLNKKRKMQKRNTKQSVKPNKREKTDYVDDLVSKYVTAKESKRPKRRWYD